MPSVEKIRMRLAGPNASFVRELTRGFAVDDAFVGRVVPRLRAVFASELPAAELLARLELTMESIVCEARERYPLRSEAAEPIPLVLTRRSRPVIHGVPAVPAASLSAVKVG